MTALASSILLPLPLCHIFPAHNFVRDACDLPHFCSCKLPSHCPFRLNFIPSDIFLSPMALIPSFLWSRTFKAILPKPYVEGSDFPPLTLWVCCRLAFVLIRKSSLLFMEKEGRVGSGSSLSIQESDGAQMESCFFLTALCWAGQFIFLGLSSLICRTGRIIVYVHLIGWLGGMKVMVCVQALSILFNK